LLGELTTLPETPELNLEEGIGKVKKAEEEKGKEGKEMKRKENKGKQREKGREWNLGGQFALLVLGGACNLHQPGPWRISDRKRILTKF